MIRVTLQVINIKTLKQATPNLRIINLYGISFLDDSHIEAFSSNCIQLQVSRFDSVDDSVENDYPHRFYASISALACEAPASRSCSNGAAISSVF